MGFPLPWVSVFLRACVVNMLSFLNVVAMSRCWGVVIPVGVISCIFREKLSVSSSVASAVGLGSLREASEAPKSPWWFGQKGFGFTPVGVMV